MKKAYFTTEAQAQAYNASALALYLSQFPGSRYATYRQLTRQWARVENESGFFSVLHNENIPETGLDLRDYNPIPAEPQRP